MAFAKGMLSGIFAPQAGDPEQEAQDAQALQLAKMTPFQAAAATAYGGGALAGKGVNEMLGGMTGRDIRPPVQKRTDAIEAAKTQVSQMGFDPSDPASVDKFYKNVIMILQKQGLAGEALDVADEWHKQKVADEKARIEIEKAKAANAKNAASQAAAEERNRILKAKNLPELERMIQVVESFDPIMQAPQREMRLKALNAMLESKQKGIVLEDLNDRVVVRNRATGELLVQDDKGATPMNEKDAAKASDKKTAQASAFSNAMAKLQYDYDAAVRLYSHPGIEGITGRLGRLVGEPGVAGQSATTMASAASRAGLDLWHQVVGATFLNGLNELKAASPVGSTGLGQTSNIEGDKVQSAKAALRREQDAPDFRLNLKIYIQALEDQAARLNAAAAAGDGSIAQIPLQQRALTLPAGTKPTAPRAPRAAPVAPAAPAAAGGDMVKIKTPDGRTGSIPRANLEAAKAAGAVEVK